MSLSACSLLYIKLGTFVELRHLLRTCLDVFQNNFEFELELDSRPSSLSKYSFFDFLISSTILIFFKGAFSFSNKAFYMTRYPWILIWPDGNYFVRYRFLTCLHNAVCYT